MGVVPIDANSLACGLAAYKREAVITPDVRTDPRWKDWAWLAQAYRYRACWSFPVEATSGKVVGTFTLYREEVGEPTARDRELAMRFAQSAAIIISRQQEADERAHGVEALRRAAPTARRTSFSRCSRTNCTIRLRRSPTRANC
ncbi:hypothetical protein A6456_37085 [Paraburkholderia tropica]|nr:hypothetical protein A6456_37085 [Paraburkholderia tropica]